ncbi:MAG: UvrD-helicase domain-containing protein, partial [Planctomycetota bacterium]|nr:UvrD-helicase domain-containing protein [Planctomycetota bacterium]
MSDHIPEPLVLLASAGTGKTFRLSSRFLELVANGAPVQDILATTFTKKAAGEILDRILVRLSKAALEESAFAELLKHVEVPDEWSREHAIRLLRDLVKNLHRFEVRTLDAWFQQNLQVVALELGLPPGWSVGDPFDLSDLRAQAILEVIAGLAPSQADALLRDLQQHEFKRSVFEGLLDLLDRTLNIHLSADNTGNPWDSLSDCSQPPVQEMEESAAILAQIKVPTTGKGTPNKNWATNVTKLVKAWQDRSWKEVLSSSL